jgi:hypothetical protein
VVLARAAACSGDQLVQLSLAGLVVAVAAPPEAVTPVRAGIEKKVFSHAVGAAAVMLASLVSVTVSGLPPWPDAATVTAVVKVCELPVLAVEKFQMTSLGVVAMHPDWVVVSALVVYPVAYVVFVGRFTPVTVTGNEFGFEIVRTTSPDPPGYKTLLAAGVATAVTVRLDTVADWASPLEPPASPTAQFVAA